MAVAITFILESAKTHNELQVTRILSPNNKLGGHHAAQISRVQPLNISNETRQLRTGCQAKPTIVQTSVYQHRVPSMNGTRSHVIEASMAKSSIHR